MTRVDVRRGVGAVGVLGGFQRPWAASALPRPRSPSARLSRSDVRFAGAAWILGRRARPGCSRRSAPSATPHTCRARGPKGCRGGAPFLLEDPRSPAPLFPPVKTCQPRLPDLRKPGRPVSAGCQGVADGPTLGGIAAPREGAMATPGSVGAPGWKAGSLRRPRLLERSF